nr:hypothetical protein [Moorena bouillonii]
MEFPMSTEDAPINNAVLVTIIGESVIRESLVKLIKSHGATGYTVSDVRGEGGHGRRLGDIPGYNTNVEIKTIVSREVSDAILRAIAEYRNRHALIAYRQDIETLSN